MEGHWVVLCMYWQWHTATSYRSQIRVLRVWAWGQVHFHTLHYGILCFLFPMQALCSASDTRLPLPREVPSPHIPSPEARGEWPLLDAILTLFQLCKGLILDGHGWPRPANHGFPPLLGPQPVGRRWVPSPSFTWLWVLQVEIQIQSFQVLMSLNKDLSRRTMMGQRYMVSNRRGNHC